MTSSQIFKTLLFCLCWFVYEVSFFFFFTLEDKNNFPQRSELDFSISIRGVKLFTAQKRFSDLKQNKLQETVLREKSPWSLAASVSMVMQQKTFLYFRLRLSTNTFKLQMEVLTPKNSSQQNKKKTLTIFDLEKMVKFLQHIFIVELGICLQYFVIFTVYQ